MPLQATLTWSAATAQSADPHARQPRPESLTLDMADEATSPNDETSLGDENAGKRRSSILAKINVLIFVVIVIGAECSVAYLYLPSPSETATMASAALAPPSSDALLGSDQAARECTDDPKRHP